MLGVNIEKIDALIEAMLHAARIPGAAIGLVVGDRCVLAKGYGQRDLDAKLPVTGETLYPIASTTKAINATLLGMLVDEGRLAWDRPVQCYVPRFCLRDPYVSAHVTLRDLVTMRTGLPRHDWVWLEGLVTRAELVDRLRHLDLSAGLRERFQYNNLTVTLAGHVAEIVTGWTWEDLVRQKILDPLHMCASAFSVPASENVTQSYQENSRREMVLTRELAAEVTAPSGGAIYSTVEDMSRWIEFNLNGGVVEGRALIRPETLREIHSPQTLVGLDPSAPTASAAYAIGWFVDRYNSFARLSHSGLLHGVNSSVMLFPEQPIGIVSFTNFAAARLASLINQHVFDLIMGLPSAQSLGNALAQCDGKLAEVRQRNALVRRVESTSPSHELDDYVGVYLHRGYGALEIRRKDETLILRRNRLVLPLVHWHYDSWVAAENDYFEMHRPHAFDQTSRILFETDVDGQVAACRIHLEPAVAPIRFERRTG